MRLRRAITAAVLPIPMLFVGMAQPAAAAGTHKVTLSGEMLVSNAPGIGKSRTTGKFRFERQAILTHTNRERTLSFSACQGGETRGVLTVHLQLRSSDMVVVSPTLRLYEGSSCNSNDLDGEQQGIQTGFFPGKKLSWQLRAKNSEFLSGDLVSTSFALTQSTSPPEASNVVATRVPEDIRSVRVRWVDNAADETEYQIRNTTTNQTRSLRRNTTTVTWFNLDPFVKQCFQVRAVNSIGPSDWTPVNRKGECA